MHCYSNILNTIGQTPLIRINKLIHTPATVWAKVEAFNPSHSAKDRMAYYMIEVAEKRGQLKPNGTIIEATSGNTGMALALAASIKGYQCIFVLSKKQSKLKIDLLRAMGAEVVLCPTGVKPADPRSYYSVAQRLSEEIPNSCYINQYHNIANREAYYYSLGPEIWEQTKGKVTHLIASVGTGGTLCGTGQYLKEQNPAIKVMGADAYGSVLKKYHETGIFDEKEIYPYVLEAVGKDIIPSTIDWSIIDEIKKVSDRAAALTARQLTKQEGLFCGYSSGAAMHLALQLQDQYTTQDCVVVILPDHGSRYVQKIYNDEWMYRQGFLEKAPVGRAYVGVAK